MTDEAGARAPRIKRINPPRVTVIITAGGSGTRFGGRGEGPPKQFHLLRGVPILTRTVEAFSKMDCVDEIVISLPRGFEFDLPFSKIRTVTEGGESRQASVYEALRKVSAETDIVLIHDGVRPLVTERLTKDVIDCVRRGYAAVAGVKATDRIKQTDADGIVISTPDRARLWQVQTPQGFTYEVIKKAHEMARAEGFTGTDDSTLVERYKLAPVKMVEGDRVNIKITEQRDMQIAEAYINETQHLNHGGIHNLKNVTIYTDGACSGNPGPGGYGTVLLYNTYRKELSEGFAQTTNNRMEILSVIAGLEALREPCNVTVFSDSRYVVDAVTKGWAKRWRANNWMRTKTDPALNADLWERLLKLLETHNVKFNWVKGHAGNPENERCDELARGAIAGL